MGTVRHDYFHCIERPIQAYLLGLLASDGCILSDRPRIQLQVLERDRILVEIIQEELAPGYPIKISPYKDKDYNMAKICFTSTIMCRDLARYNVIPRKSLVLTWPDALPSNLVNSYLLGILDGDGWITIDRRKLTPYYTIGFMSASPAFLERAAQEISSILDISPANLSAVNHRAFSIRYGGRSAVLIDAWLHRDLRGLDRKRIFNQHYS